MQKNQKVKIDRIIRSNRKSFSLQIESDATLVVRVPQRASLRSITKIVSDRSDWILRKQNEALRKIDENPPRQYIQGEEFYLIGETYSLAFSDKAQVSVKIYQNTLCLGSNCDNPEDTIIRWYKRQAKKIITERVEDFAQAHQLGYNKIRITTASKRWGSCTTDDNLNFNWKLIMAPLYIIDYVVAHELAHLKQHNHSKYFWKEVEKMCPDYKIHRKWLKDNGHLLAI